MAGCRLSEPYLVPRRSLELVSSLQPNLRPRAQVPAVRESDRGPALVDYRAFQLTDQELEKLTAQKPGPGFYRIRAAQRNPLLLIGAVVMGMALPHFLLGLSVGLDAPTYKDSRAISDQAGGAVAMTLVSMHLAAGIGLIAYGETHPRVVPAEPQLIYQYMGPAPPPQPDRPADAEPAAEKPAGPEEQR